MLDEISDLVQRAMEVPDALARRVPGPLRITDRPLKEVGHCSDWTTVPASILMTQQTGCPTTTSTVFVDSWPIL
jgi:hypothetical protein